jgi:cytochrome c-type biogenesis protein CcmH
MNTRGFVLAGTRGGFVAGLSTGLVLASAAFMIYGLLVAPAESKGTAVASGGVPADRWHQGAAEGSLAEAIRASATLLPSTRSGGGSVEDLLGRAEQLRRQRDFKQACELYATVVERGGMTADAWADYADAQASVAGRLAGAPARAIEAALALDPRHAKSLWLDASLAHEERRYADALATWRRLLAIVPPGSSDASIVQANIAEAARLASS